MCMIKNELAKQIEELKELKNMALELDAEISALEDEIKKIMGDEQELLSGPWKITYKPVKSSRLDTARLKTEQPELYQRFLKTSTSRRFVIA